jgi:hypothetical protein
MFNIFDISGKFYENILLVRKKFITTQVYECLEFKYGKSKITFLTEDDIKRFKGKVIIGNKDRC